MLHRHRAHHPDTEPSTGGRQARSMRAGSSPTRARHRSHIAVPALVAALVVSAGACSSDDGSGSSSTADTKVADAATYGVLPQGSDPVELDPATFTTDIDNPYWPMDPGTRWVYKEIDEEGAEVEVTVVVTEETRELANGITALVLRDWVVKDGEIIEDTYDWYAQDADGNVWYLGEDTAEFEGGEIVSTAGSWEASVDGALPGIIVPADPQPGMRYRQEFYEGEAEDNGEVLSVSEMAEVPAGSYTDQNVLLTKDTITIEPDVLEYKLYAPGVGPVLILGVSGGGGREELVSIDTVPTAGLITELGFPPTLD
jgi:hypothetical protein